ncbi:MAG: hypothetical protein KAR87_03435 [Candidatus Aenigmarchaeota archaeon]|nr:hypothetical protein [Candidatus Aenigmarchaeota archaeon]MCK5176921.1 hypothetical protein [Candidatus Aenigmarchaeota archaeon]
MDQLNPQNAQEDTGKHKNIEKNKLVLTVPFPVPCVPVDWIKETFYNYVVNKVF